jgi:hypothetical protein
MQDWRGLRVFSITLETRLFRILSPVRLPVPPPRLTFKVYSLPKRTTLVKIIKDVRSHPYVKKYPGKCFLFGKAEGGISCRQKTSR